MSVSCVSKYSTLTLCLSSAVYVCFQGAIAAVESIWHVIFFAIAFFPNKLSFPVHLAFCAGIVLPGEVLVFWPMRDARAVRTR